MGFFKRSYAVLLSVTLLVQLSACSFSEAAHNTASFAKEKAAQTKDFAVGLYNKIDMSKFKDGWDSAVDFASSKYSAAMGSKYVTDVGNAIEKLKNDVNASVGSARNTAQEAGFIAEKWVADTFNIDSVASGSDHSASVVGSNKMGSADVITSYGETASLKYYKSAKSSASAQATTFLQEYKKYSSKSDNPMTIKQYLNKYDKPLDAMYASIYEGQTRIIPEDQYDDAVAFLKGKYNTFSEYAKMNGSEHGKVRSEGYEETLNRMKARLQAPDGTASKPITYEELQGVAELAQKGEFEPSKFGISTSQIITPKYLIKQSLNSGITSATLNTVFTVGPDIFSILKKAAKEGNFDEEQLKSTGIEGLISASEGFLEGSVSCAILSACQSGKLGAAFVDVSPEIIGTLTVLTIDAVRFGYTLSKGDITPMDYSNLMAEEVFVAICSQATGTALKTLLPFIPFAYMAGTLAGGMIATAGFEIVREVVLEIKDGGGFEVVVPKGVINTMNVITDKISGLHLEDKVTDLKEMAVSTANNGYIKIKSLVE